MNEPARWFAIAAALLLAALALRARPSARAVTWATAVASTALSALYIPVYLRGGPRIIDATSYWLEARALAEGHLAWPLADPEAATAGRFLVRDTLAALPAHHVAVIFPPGYPAVLALGFLVGAPLAIGPLLAGLLTLSIARLARVLADHVGLDPSRADMVQTAAAVLSALSATLRYHTADAMSHGLAALGFTSAVLGALSATRAGPRAWPAAILSGFSLGLLVATRPVSGVACAGTLAFVLGRAVARRELAPRRLALGAALALAAAAPGLLLLLLHQHAATGAWLRSAQDLYYAANDGPPGCFRYGFGAGIGCRLEHGPYVDHNLQHGYDFLSALHTTGIRLWVHAGDALNAFWVGPLTLASVAYAAARPGLRVLAIGPVLQIALYAPFYFDGSYPGAGARFYADVLPLELVAIALAASALVELAARRAGAGDSTRDRWRARAPLLLGVASLLLFAARGAKEHELLRDRDGGAPMFDAAFVRRELAARGPEARRPVVFVRTDHGFNLAFDPDRRAPYDVARLRGDAIDRLTLASLGARDAFLYEYAIDGAHGPELVPYAPRADAPIEAEALYPPVRQRCGWSFTREAADASSGRELGVDPGRCPPRAEPVATIDLALPRALGDAEITPIVRGGGRLTVTRGGEVVATWDFPECDAPLRHLEPRALSRFDPSSGLPVELPVELEIVTGCPSFGLDGFVVGRGVDPVDSTVRP
ncbi:MAG: hypothetical protein U0414_32465 [Polyangiaceae bacterium]